MNEITAKAVCVKVAAAVDEIPVPWWESTLQLEDDDAHGDHPTLSLNLNGSLTVGSRDPLVPGKTYLVTVKEAE